VTPFSGDPFLTLPNRVDLSFVVAKGLQQPNGLAVKDGALYIADIDKVYKIEKAIDLVHKVSMLYQQPYDAELDDASGYFPLTLVYDAFPSDEAHGWRYMSVGYGFVLNTTWKRFFF
jgi:hypothetical protein